MIRTDPANPWTTPAAGRAQPGLTLLLGHLIATFGGSSNGIYVNRPMRGSSRPSLHRDGRALDWLQPDDRLRAQGAEFCAQHAEALQVQEIHRYKESLAWNPREDWHRATGEAFGAAWAGWIHVERNLVGSADTRPIEEILYVPEPEPEDDMILIKTERGFYACSGAQFVTGGLAPQSLVQSLTDAGVKVVEMSAETMQKNFGRVDPDLKR